ncbi:hypothetical protein ABH945_006838 [Paraburkholderia sp. GAS333]
MQLANLNPALDRGLDTSAGGSILVTAPALSSPGQLAFTQ